jgi:hypothetical protein
MITWADFKSAVDSHLAVESNRRGLEAFRDRYTRNAVLDLQRYIRAYRDNNATIYTGADMELQTAAQLGQLPQGAKPKAFYIICATGATPTPVPRNDIASWTDLAAVPTKLLPVGTIYLWVDSASDSLKATQLRTGTDASDPTNGVQRGDDYADPGNTKVWYEVN